MGIFGGVGHLRERPYPSAVHASLAQDHIERLPGIAQWLGCNARCRGVRLDLIALTGTVLERVSQKVDSLSFKGARLAIALMGSQSFIGADLYRLGLPANTRCVKSLRIGHREARFQFGTLIRA